MYIDPKDTSLYRPSMFTAIVAPRPIGWISTMDECGTANLAPFSYFNGISATPPMLMFACNAPDDRLEKDTLRNVRATGQFVVNLATWALRHAMVRSSDTVAHGVDEFDLTGVTKAASRLVRPPQVAESPVSMECEVLRIVDFEPQYPQERRSSVTFGRVVAIRIDDDYVDAQGRFDVLRAAPIARLQGFNYLVARDLFELQRPRGHASA